MKKLNLLGILLVLISTGAWAQNEVKASKFENVSWNQIVMIKFAPGKMDRAKEIIKIYDDAGKAAKTQGPEKYWMATGDYDLMVIWKLDGGPSDLEWQISPDDVKWMAEMVKSQGSDENVQKLQVEFSGLINNSNSYLSRKEL